MNLLLREVHKSPSLIAFSDYREAEALNELQTSVSRSGELLEYETLELRVHPPNINIDNDFSPDFTLITVDSANRPGTLVEVLHACCSCCSLVLCALFVTPVLCLPGCPTLHGTRLGCTQSSHLLRRGLVRRRCGVEMSP